jgi:diketogulonate reductase-like aldo/keto reductase
MPARRRYRSVMDARGFGATERQVPAIGQGTWQIDRGGRAEAIAALRLGLDRGMTHVDTAEMYDGAEAIVAEAIAGRRDEVFLVSKVLPSNASRQGTIAACERSLARLRTDYLDCYLLHWRTEAHALEQTIAAFDRLERDGKIRAWGVSNFDVADLDDAWRIGGEGLTCNQVLYHLQERAIDHAVLPWCEQRGVAVVAYSPFGQDRFPSPRSEGGRVLQAIAETHGVTPRAVALRFLIRRPALFTIPKASSAAHVAENAAAGDLQLTDADVARIDRAFPRGPQPRELPML